VSYWLFGAVLFGVPCFLFVGFWDGFSLQAVLYGALGGALWSTFMSMRDPWRARGALVCGIFLVPFMTVVGVMNWQDGHRALGILGFGVAGVALLGLRGLAKRGRANRGQESH